MTKAVFLDRDGVLNSVVDRGGEAGSPRSLAELHIPADVPVALGRLASAGFVLLGVTNQPEIARGQVSAEMVDSINARLMSDLPVREFFVCRHVDADECDCRKPKPGLIRAAAAKHAIDVPASFMVGDRWKDVDAGRAAGCRTILIDQGWAGMAGASAADYTAHSLANAADWILAQAAEARHG